jgi:cyclic pyranopterin phosphate synthase
MRMHARKVERTAGWNDPREIVMIRYLSRSGDAGEVWEGYVRTSPGPRLVGTRPAVRRTTRYQRTQMKELSHVDAAGKARMVDVSEKPVTARSATARGHIVMKPETLVAIRDNAIAKGDVLGVARIAGIQAAKRTAELVPLCHQLPLSGVSVDFELDESLPGVRVTASARTAAQTGVEMEAIMAVSVTLVTLYDMAKGVDKGMVIGEISLTEKRGGKSGDWVRT